MPLEPTGATSLAAFRRAAAAACDLEAQVRGDGSKGMIRESKCGGWGQVRWEQAWEKPTDRESEKLAE